MGIPKVGGVYNPEAAAASTAGRGGPVLGNGVAPSTREIRGALVGGVYTPEAAAASSTGRGGPVSGNGVAPSAREIQGALVGGVYTPEAAASAGRERGRSRSPRRPASLYEAHGDRPRDPRTRRPSAKASPQIHGLPHGDLNLDGPLDPEI